MREALKTNKKIVLLIAEFLISFHKHTGTEGKGALSIRAGM